MVTKTDSQAIGKEAAAAAQAKLTQSVGATLTRESHDAAMPGWKRWLKKMAGRA
jgi:hypothetical protein